MSWTSPRSGIPGYRVAVLCPPGPLADRLRAAGAEVTTGPVGPEHGVRSALTATRSAVRALRPAVVHSHLSWADVVTAAATVGSGTALVSTEHGIADDDLVYHGTAWRSRVKAALHTVRLRRADAVIAVSDATARSVRARWHPGRSTTVHVVRNGVDPLPRDEPRGPGLHVCSIARFAPEKRLDALVRAFASLAATHSDARLTLAGTGRGGAVRAPPRRRASASPTPPTSPGTSTPGTCSHAPTSSSSCRCGRTARTPSSTPSSTGWASSPHRWVAIPRSCPPQPSCRMTSRPRSRTPSPGRGSSRPLGRHCLPGGPPGRRCAPTSPRCTTR